MRHDPFKTIIFISFFFKVLSSVNAQQFGKPKVPPAGSWKLLGSVEASHAAKHDVILIKGAHDYFRKIKFNVTDSPINLQLIVVTYDDGFPERFKPRMKFLKVERAV